MSWPRACRCRTMNSTLSCSQTSSWSQKATSGPAHCRATRTKLSLNPRLRLFRETRTGNGASRANSSTSVDRTKNVVVYGTPNPPADAQPVVKGLTAGNVQVTYSGFGVNAGSVTVSIVNYDFSYVVALFGSTLRMPAYRTTLTGENAGYAPPNL